MELRDLKTFVTVASLLNFNRAGHVLHAAQSTVSVRIQTLEEELGVRLFDRLGRRVILTEAGERLLGYGKKILDMEEEARAWVSGTSKARGVLTIRVPETLCVKRLSGVLRRFGETFPQVRLRLLPCVFDGLTEDLRRGVTDLAFVLAYEVLSQDMRWAFLGTEDLVVVVAPGHPFASRLSVGPEDFKGQTLLLATSDCSYRRTFEGILAQAGSLPPIGVECGSLEAVKRFAAAGLGVTVLPEISAREEIAAGTLMRLPWADAPLEAAVLMLWHKDKWLSPALAGFMEYCREGLMADGKK
jgi:DNA-binding transcriptional LysR family regulator